MSRCSTGGRLEGDPRYPGLCFSFVWGSRWSNPPMTRGEYDLVAPRIFLCTGESPRRGPSVGRTNADILLRFVETVSFTINCPSYVIKYVLWKSVSFTFYYPSYGIKYILWKSIRLTFYCPSYGIKYVLRKAIHWTQNCNVDIYCMEKCQLYGKVSFWLRTVLLKENCQVYGKTGQIYSEL